MSTPTIVLVRHAKPHFNTSRWVRTSNMRYCISAYNESGIEAHGVDIGTHGLETAVDAVVAEKAEIATSRLPRSVESATEFFPRRAAVADSLYREAELPYALPLWGLRLPFSVAVAVARVFWILGMHGEAESYSMTRARSKRAAKKLAESATRNGCVILVGHGFFNYLVGRQLKRAGWTVRRFGGKSFGAYRVFRWPTQHGRHRDTRGSLSGRTRQEMGSACDSG